MLCVIQGIEKLHKGKLHSCRGASTQASPQLGISPSNFSTAEKRLMVNTSGAWVGKNLTGSKHCKFQQGCSLTPQMLGMEASLQTMPRIASMSFSCRASMLGGAVESL